MSDSQDQQTRLSQNDFLSDTANRMYPQCQSVLMTSKYVNKDARGTSGPPRVRSLGRPGNKAMPEEVLSLALSEGRAN